MAKAMPSATLAAAAVMELAVVVTGAMTAAAGLVVVRAAHSLSKCTANRAAPMTCHIEKAVALSPDGPAASTPAAAHCVLVQPCEHGADLAAALCLEVQCPHRRQLAQL